MHTSHTATSIDRRRAESLPHNRLTDVGCYEERNAGAETVSFLQQLVKQQHNEPGNKQLDYDEQADAGSNLRRQTIHASHDVDDSLSNRDHHAEHCNHRHRYQHVRLEQKNHSHLTLWRPLCHMCTAIKHPVPATPGWAVICNFWHPGTTTLSPERQSDRMSKITGDGLTRSGTGCFIAVPIWHSGHQRVNSLELLAARYSSTKFFSPLIVLWFKFIWAWFGFSVSNWLQILLFGNAAMLWNKLCISISTWYCSMPKTMYMFGSLTTKHNEVHVNMHWTK